MTRTPTSAKTRPRATVPTVPIRSTQRRVRGFICAVRRYFVNLWRIPSITRISPAVTLMTPTMPTSSRPPEWCMAEAGRSRCWPAGLLAGDHLEGQVGKACIHQPPAQRLQPATCAIAVTGDTERGFAKTPERVGHEADAEQPQRDQAVRLADGQL